MLSFLRLVISKLKASSADGGTAWVTSEQSASDGTADPAQENNPPQLNTSARFLGSWGKASYQEKRENHNQEAPESVATGKWKTTR